MARRGWLEVAVVSTLCAHGATACAPRGGKDPREAPGCTLGAYRCDGDVLQICQVDAAERRKTWWDVHDCAAFGGEIGETLVCRESVDDEKADCVAATAAAADVGASAEATYAAEPADCVLDQWRCHDDVAQACARAPAGMGNAWWDIADCRKIAAELGQPMACSEADGGASADCEAVDAEGGADVSGRP